MANTRNRRVGSVAIALVHKSREAALSAVQVYNNPLVQFKSESFIVLMVIAWTYLLHAYYRREGVEYRHFETRGKRRVFKRTRRGRYMYWELEHCLNQTASPIDGDTANNLRFLIGLRHEIEHEMSLNLDTYLSGRYQACALNYDHYLRSLFGERYALDQHLAYSIQFAQLSHQQIVGGRTEESLRVHVKAYIAEFDNQLTEDEYNSDRFSYRLLFTPKLANRRGQADAVVEFVDAHSVTGADLQQLYVARKDVERRKFLPSQVVNLIQSDGFTRFTMHSHFQLWKRLNAKANGKGLGVQIANTWYWYEPWIEVVRSHCQENSSLYK